MRNGLVGLLLIGLASAPAAAQGPAADANVNGAPPTAAHRAHADDGKDADTSNESNTDYLWRKSDEAFHAGDYERAVGLHRAIVALDPSDVQSYSVASWLLWSMGKSDEALAFLLTGLKANPDNWDMWDEAAQQYGLMKRDTDALAAYTHAVQMIPKDEDSQMLRRRLAHSQEKNGDVKGAVSTWRGLVKDFPDEPVNKNNLARAQKLLDKATATGTAWHYPDGLAGALAGLTVACCLSALLHPSAPPRV